MAQLFANRDVLLQGLAMTLALTVCVLLVATILASMLAAGLMARRAIFRCRPAS